jgi:hypothetical protein
MGPSDFALYWTNAPAENHVMLPAVLTGQLNYFSNIGTMMIGLTKNRAELIPSMVSHKNKNVTQIREIPEIEFS